MKYTIEGLSQQQLIELGLDNTDALIIRWFLDFKATDKMAKIYRNDFEYFWIKYESIINEFPSIYITNKETIARRFKKYVQAGIMINHTEKNAKGTFSCYNTTDKILDLIYQSTQKSNGVDSKVDTGVDSKVDTKDPSTKLNHSTKNHKKIADKSAYTDEQTKTHNELIALFSTDYEFFYKTKLVFDGKEVGNIKKLVLSYSYTDIKDKYAILKENVEDTKNTFYFLLPSMLLSQWNRLVVIDQDTPIDLDAMRKKYNY